MPRRATLNYNSSWTTSPLTVRRKIYYPYDSKESCGRGPSAVALQHSSGNNGQSSSSSSSSSFHQRKRKQKKKRKSIKDPSSNTKSKKKLIRKDSNVRLSSCLKKDNELNNDSIRTTDTVASSVSSSSSSSQSLKSGKDNSQPLQKAVSFGYVEIQEYRIQLGDNPCPTDGPSITISWKPLKNRAKRYSVDYYEEQRRDEFRRQEEDLVLSPKTRIMILQRQGYASEDIMNAMILAEQIRRSREQSIASMRWDLWAASTEWIVRKLKKSSTIFISKKNEVN